MQLHKSKDITEDIRRDFDTICSYFEGISQSGITCNTLVYRIRNELSGRIETLRLTVGATLRSYLSADARLAMESWSAQNKNRFFDAHISRKVNWAFANHAVLFPYRSFSKLISGAVVLFFIFAAFAAIAGLRQQAGLITGCVMLLLAFMSYRFLPVFLNRADNRRCLKVLSGLLEHEKRSLTIWAEKVIAEYVSEFEKVQVRAGEPNEQ